MKIKCLLLTALLLAVTSAGFARPKAATVASNVIVKNLSAAQKAERLRSLSLTTFAKNPLIQTDDERAGSADTLSGKVYVVSIFISTPDNPWKKQDKLNTFEKQREAQNWLVEQAAEYDVELEFENGTYGLNGDDISVENIPVSDKTGKGMSTEWSSYLLKKIGYKTPLGLWDWVEEKTDCTNLQVIVFSNSKGVSYASYYTPGTDKEKYFVELALVHRYYPTGPELYSSTIAHETLHLYGAWDLYNTYKHKKEKDVAAKSKQLFPNDIMYRVSNNVAEQDINEVTAWRLGWNDDEKSWYKWFEPGK